MLKQIEGSRAMAEAIALCRPEVICAYPITPQTHIVEALAGMAKDRRLENCEFINVESDFAALSVTIGASAAGARAYTATASQGLLQMAEAVYNASGLGLPIVMTLVNRAIGAPANMWNDHSDAMSMRDAGWVQLFAETNQEAADLHIQAFKLAEELSIPVMVCVDGFVLTHAVERVEIPLQAMVDAYLPPYDPVQVLDPAQPVTMGASVGPDAFTEVRFLSHYKQTKALRFITQFASEFAKVFGRESGGLLRGYRMEDAQMVVIAMGSVCGTIKDTIDEMRGDEHPDRPCNTRLLPAISDRRLAGDPRRRSGGRGDRQERLRRHGRPARKQCRRGAQNLAAPAAPARGGGGPWRTSYHPPVFAPPFPASGGRALGGNAFPRSQRARRRPGNPSRGQEAPHRPNRRSHPALSRGDRSRPGRRMRGKP